MSYLDLSWYETSPTESVLEHIDWSVFQNIPTLDKPFILSNSIFPFESWKLVGPHIQFLGPLVPNLDELYNLDEGLLSWLKSSTEDVLFIYLGQTSLIKSHVVEILSG